MLRKLLQLLMATHLDSLVHGLEDGCYFKASLGYIVPGKTKKERKKMLLNLLCFLYTVEVGA